MIARTRKFLMVAIVICILMVTSFSQVQEIWAALKQNWVPAASDLHTTGVDLRNYAQVVKDGPKIGEARAGQREATASIQASKELDKLRRLQEKAAYAEAARLALASHGATPVPPPLPHQPTLEEVMGDPESDAEPPTSTTPPGVAPLDRRPVHFYDTKQGNYPLYNVINTADLVSATYYAPTLGESATISFKRDAHILHVEYQDGRTNDFAIKWEGSPYYHWTGNVGSYNFWIKTEKVPS